MNLIKIGEFIFEEIYLELMATELAILLKLVILYWQKLTLHESMNSEKIW